MPDIAPQILVVATREEMIAEAKGIVDAARARGIVLRLLGGLAARHYCQSLDFCERDHGDIDLIGHRRDAGRIESLFTELGYQENRHVQMATEGRQLQFVRKCRHGDEWSEYRPHDEDHADVFLDTFKLEHAVDLSDRLELDDYAITASDVLLIKLQMAQLEEKDERDIYALLQDLPLLGAGESPGGPGDHGVIDVAYIARLCSRDWGLFHDVRLSLAHLKSRLAAFGADADVEDRVRNALSVIDSAIETEPKAASWRLRARVGTRLPWRNTVEEQD
jgi:hypothetical protein